MTIKKQNDQGLDRSTSVADMAPLIFISYSHVDEIWKDELRSQIAESRLQADIVVWDDRKIEPTDEWYQTIRGVMARATAAICLISPTYLRSKFCVNEEIPYLLKRREEDGMLLIFLLVYPCEWQEISWLGKRQLLPRGANSVAAFSEEERKRCYQESLDFVATKLADPGFQMPQPRILWSPPEDLDLSRLPTTGAELFGRERELYELEQAWRNQDLNIFSLVAWGGVGKSTLVNKWLERMAEDNFRDAHRVYGWSFFSQGTGDRVTSADLFIQTALEWFGDPDPSAGSPWSKGERLATLIRAQRSLLVLDGIEPLQSDRDFDHGTITDPGLSVLITELARENSGLCVITTRERVSELTDFESSVMERNLNQISAEAGRSLMRVKGVRGTDSALEDAARAFGNNALAVNLFAAYLRNICGHPVAAATDISDLDIPDEEGRHARRMMVAFADRFGEGPEVELLRVISLFDRSAKLEWIHAVLAPPPIPHLTDHLHGLSEGTWRDLLDRLREMWLLAPRHHHDPNLLDAHPLVREHFGEAFSKQWPDSFQIAHDRLYEYFQSNTDIQPETLLDMIPLYTAISHGCKAGLHQDALDNVFINRIRRRELHYSIHALGAFNLELAALANFFEQPWDQGFADLDENSVSFVQHEASACLVALGRLTEAIAPNEGAFQAAFTRGHWPNAALSAAHLSNLCLLTGEIKDAIDWARTGVDLAERSKDQTTAGLRFTPMQNLTMLGYILCQAGLHDEAGPLFEKAERAQQAGDPTYQQLISIKHFRYCDWLLAAGDADEVIKRTTYTLPLHTNEGWLLDIGLDHLLLGRAYFIQQQRSKGNELSKSLEELNRAVDGLREAGYREYLVLGLLARVSIFRTQGSTHQTHRDLAEAMTLIRRGGITLFEANAHLEYGHLYLAEGDKDKARKHLEAATVMIDDMGYHRLDGEVAELHTTVE